MKYLAGFMMLWSIHCYGGHNPDSLMKVIYLLRLENAQLRAIAELSSMVTQIEATRKPKVWRHNLSVGAGQGGTIGFPLKFTPSILGNYVAYTKKFAINGFFGWPVKDLAHPFLSISGLIPLFDKQISFGKGESAKFRSEE